MALLENDGAMDSLYFILADGTRVPIRAIAFEMDGQFLAARSPDVGLEEMDSLVADCLLRNLERHKKKSAE